MLSDPPRLRQMGVAAQERARTFSWEATADGFEKALFSAISGSRGRRR
jgi:hypothetical protein